VVVKQRLSSSRGRRKGWKVRKHFFLKKEAKTFAPWCARWRNARAKEQKFFGSFFQKRTAALPNHPPHEPYPNPQTA
jgi:hypothetical protein